MLNRAFAATLLAIICCSSWTNNHWAVVAYPNYATRLPNGDAVKSPCGSSGELWPGVGHFSQAGGGPRNPFGLDFLAENFKWTQQLCRKDSDGDGRSNGEELGDPHCTWREGGAPPGGNSVITHPGICEPVASEKCARLNGDFKCPDKFNCSAIHQPGVRKMDLRLKDTAVPPKETTYMCQAFEVSSLEKEHMIAAVPVIDNPSVLHHMIIYGCSKKPDMNPNQTFECGMSTGNCYNLIDIWGLGMRPGNCYRDNAGAPFGLQGYQYVVLQLHWNNPNEITTWRDSSGFELYFSPTLREYDTGVMMYGQTKLDLKPGQAEIHRTATCDQRCSRSLMPEAGHKLLWGTLHMHNYGTRGKVSLLRDGKVIRDLIPMHDFDYDTPVVFEYDQPIEYLPGDEIRTDCYYSTSRTNRSVYWGESTQEEMCYGFFQYYPHNRTKAMAWPNIDMCSSFGKVDYCVLGLKSVEKYVVDNCDMKEVTSGRLYKKYEDQVQRNCYHTYQYRCSDQCLAWYRQVKANDPCLNGESLDFVQVSRSLRGLATYWDLCAQRDQNELLKEANDKIDELTKRPPPATAPPTISLLNYDLRLLLVSGSYMFGLLVAVVLVIVILKMKNSSARVEALDMKNSFSRM